MFRALAFAVPALIGLAATPMTAAQAQGYTTRIETRPFYGATVTLEEGVRVFRALPPERQVIINPEGRTPLYLGFNETRVYEYRNVQNTSTFEGAPGGGRVVYGGGVGGNWNGWRFRGPGGFGHAGGGPGMKHINGVPGGHNPMPRD